MRLAASSEHIERADADLARSGLSGPDLRRAGHVVPVPAAQVPRYLPSNVQAAAPDVLSACVYVYHTLAEETGRLVRVDPLRYCRARMFYAPLVGFAAAQTKDPRPKYLQRAGTPPELYIPPNYDWAAYLADADAPLLVTEGEKKAYAACARGLPCVALGGVNSLSHRVRERSAMLLPALVRLAQGRQVYVVFDVDEGFTTLKPAVAYAARMLALRLAEHAVATPSITVFRNDGTRKLALDDWLLERPSAGVEDLLADLVRETLPQATSAKLLEENARYAYVEELGAVMRLGDRYLLPTAAYRDSRGNEEVVTLRMAMNKDGLPTARMEAAPLSTAWMRWHGRSTATRVDYLPGNAEPLVHTPTGYEHGGTPAAVLVANRWRGWAQVPPEDPVAERQIRPWVDALRWLHGDDWAWMHDWYMYPLAVPGGKLFTIPVIQSEHEGVGKSVVPAMLCRCVYGDGVNGPGNSWTLNAGSLQDGGRLEFTAEAQFVLMDDMSDLSRVLPLLKALATQDTLAINEKFIRSRRVRNTTNTVITTNRTNPIKLTDLDRRMYYPHVNEQRSTKLWKDFVEWMTKGGGGGLLLGYARSTWATGRGAQYDPMAPAPLTDKKQEMVEISENTYDTWARRLMERCRTAALQRDLATATELADLYLLEGGGRESVPGDVNKVLFARALRVVGVHPLQGRANVGGSTYRVYVLRNAPRWARAQHGAVVRELQRVTALFKGGAGGR